MNNREQLILLCCVIQNLYLFTTEMILLLTRVDVYETLCPQQMLAPNNSIEMIQNLPRP